jgi:molybdate transport repressor ModE-like protein
VPAQLSKAFDIQRLRVLVEVARRGSVTAAAEELRLSQPTVSLHVKALNEMLGVPVVERRGRGVQLTDAGRVLEGHARRALAELERAQEAMERHRGLAGGSLHLGAGTTPGTYLLPRLLGEFHVRHPDVDLRLEVASTSGIVELIRRGELHLGVVGETAPHRDIEQRPLVRDRLVCIVPAAHAAADREEISRRELAEATLLVRRAGSSSQAVSDRWLERSRLRWRSRWELDSPEAIKQAVAAGLGVAFVSELTVRDELEQGRLAAVGVERAKLPERTLDLVRGAGQSLSPPERAFIELLDERLP